jgi:hypothetical protein
MRSVGTAYTASANLLAPGPAEMAGEMGEVFLCTRVASTAERQRKVGDNPAVRVLVEIVTCPPQG